MRVSVRAYALKRCHICRGWVQRVRMFEAVAINPMHATHVSDALAVDADHWEHTVTLTCTRCTTARSLVDAVVALDPTYRKENS